MIERRETIVERLDSSVERLDAWCSTLLTNPRPEEGADMQALIDWLFLDLATRSGDVGYIAERAVLAPLNVDSMVDKINDTVAASFYLVKCAALRPANAPPWAGRLAVAAKVAHRSRRPHTRDLASSYFAASRLLHLQQPVRP